MCIYVQSLLSSHRLARSRPCCRWPLFVCACVLSEETRAPLVGTQEIRRDPATPATADKGKHWDPGDPAPPVTAAQCAGSGSGVGPTPRCAICRTLHPTPQAVSFLAFRPGLCNAGLPSGPSRALQKGRGKWLHHLHFRGVPAKVAFACAAFSGFPAS